MTETLYQKFLECSEVTTDSRHCPEGSMFVALQGDTFNGNAFARQALDKGCRYAVVDEDVQADERIIRVDNSLSFLQELARHHRRQLATPMLAITGTNGKTTTKELTSAVLSQRYHLLCTQGNLNNAIGVPLTLLRLKPTHELAVVEMGASHPGDITELVNIAEPDYGLITNVGMAHLQGFGSFAGVCQTKGELYDYLRHHGRHTIFIDTACRHLTDMASGLQAIPYIHGQVTGNNPCLSFSWEGRQADTRLVGTYNLQNALAAITVGRFFGISDELINQALMNYTPHNNRSQLLHTTRNELIVDAYNANPTSMSAAIRNFECMDGQPKMLILGDMKELGGCSETEHAKVLGLLQAGTYERVLLIGEEFGRVNASRYPHVANVEEARQLLRAQPPTGCHILLKGSHSMHLDSLTELL